MQQCPPYNRITSELTTLTNLNLGFHAQLSLMNRSAQHQHMDGRHTEEHNEASDAGTLNKVSSMNSFAWLKSFPFTLGP